MGIAKSLTSIQHSMHYLLCICGESTSAFKEYWGEPELIIIHACNWIFLLFLQ